jgi:hypothetical protein
MKMKLSDVVFLEKVVQKNVNYHFAKFWGGAFSP